MNLHSDRVSRVRIVMPSDRSAIAPTVERVLEAAAPVGLSPDRSDDLAVAVAEALSNAAIHGNGLHHGAQVEVVVHVEAGVAVAVDVKDGGNGFDHAKLMDPTHPERLLETRGRGVFLMKRLVDKLEFSEDGSRVRLVMRARRP